MEEEVKTCEEEIKPLEKKRPTEKQLEALKRGREKRARLNQEKQAEDSKLVTLQRELQQAKEENLKIREGIIQEKLSRLQQENQALSKPAAKQAEPIKEEIPEPPVIQKPAVVPPAKTQKNTFLDSLCFC